MIANKGGMLMFQQKAAFEKRNQELKQWTDKQRDPAVEKMVCWTLDLFPYSQIRLLDAATLGC